MSQTNTLIISPSNTGFRLNNHLLIPRKNSNLPSDLEFLSEQTVFWRATVTHYKDGVVFVQLTNLEWDLSEFLDTQRFKFPINYIHFNFPEHAYSVLQRQTSNLNIHTIKVKLVIPPSIFQKSNQNILSKPIVNLSFNKQKRDETKELNFKVSIKASKASFISGCLIVSIKPFTFDEEFTVSVPNVLIRKEFSYVLPFFAKILGDDIDIEGRVRKSAKQIEILSVRSKWVEKINISIIESAKQRHTLRLIEQIPATPIEKSIFTSDDIFESIGDKNVFSLTEKDIIKTLSDAGEIKNNKQLLYLATELHCVEERIRFTLLPHFGFLFYIKGNHKQHYCWELLNSHATYIWSFPFSVAPLRYIEETITLIHKIGRQKYRSGYSNLSIQSKIESDFKLLTHKRQVSESESFNKWIDDLIKVL